MKEWAIHAKASGDAIVRCPLCRNDFGPIEELIEQARLHTRRTTHAERNTLHLGTTCRGCHKSPVQGACYQCCVCARYQLCNACFERNLHSDHRFEVKTTPLSSWQPASRRVVTLPAPLVHALQQRDLTDDDYSLLLGLDNASSTVVPLHQLDRLFPAHIYTCMYKHRWKGGQEREVKPDRVYIIFMHSNLCDFFKLKT